MLFNNCKKWDFMPNLEMEGHKLELAEERNVLRVVLRSDMKWSSNTKYIVDKAYCRLWMIRLNIFGVGPEGCILETNQECVGTGSAGLAPWADLG